MFVHCEKGPHIFLDNVSMPGGNAVTVIIPLGTSLLEQVESLSMKLHTLDVLQNVPESF